MKVYKLPAGTKVPEWLKCWTPQEKDTAERNYYPRKFKFRLGSGPRSLDTYWALPDEVYDANVPRESEPEVNEYGEVAP